MSCMFGKYFIGGTRFFDTVIIKLSSMTRENLTKIPTFSNQYTQCTIKLRFFNYDSWCCTLSFAL